MKLKAIKGKIKISVLVAILTLALFGLVANSAIASTPIVTSDITITATGVEIVSGGIVGTETTIRGTVTVSASISSVSDNPMNGAVANVYGKHWIFNPEWQQLDYGSGNTYDNDYKFGGQQASASIVWDYEWEYTFVPSEPGVYMISSLGYAHNTYLDWPTFRMYEMEREYFFDRVVISPEPNSMESGFSISVNNSIPQYYTWDGLMLTEELNLTVESVSVEIPIGTMILGTDNLDMECNGEIVVIKDPQDAAFSNPVVVKYDGEIISMFTTIFDGIPF